MQNNNNITHFDATALRRSKMQQAAREARNTPRIPSGDAGEPRDETSSLESPSLESPSLESPSLESPSLESPSLESTGAATEPVTARPETPAFEASAAAPATQEVAAAAAGVPVEQLESFLINFVVEQTGYPEEIVELDADLEADLGIDSIKKAQMFGELREHFQFEVESSGELSLDDFPTLRHIVAFLESVLGSAEGGAETPLENAAEQSALRQVSEPEACCNAASCECSDATEPRSIESIETNSETQPALASSDLQGGVGEHENLEAFLVNFVVEQTGYPPELVELDADLEADLGIDSIKKAQMFGELREVFTIEVESTEGLSLSDFPTLRDIMRFLDESASRAGTDGAEGAASPNEAGTTSANGSSSMSGDAGGLSWNGAALATDSSIIDSLRRILIEQGIADAARVNLTRHTLLMDDVGLDSIGMLDLIHAVEREYGVSISLDDLDLRGLNSASTFAALIQRKLAGLG